MMKLFRPGGAISVFLIIILVPCLVLCFLYVDLSRIELSKSTAESTADTAMNSLMANYDTLLSDYYGLVASVQNIDEFYDVTEEFFTKTLEANGVSESQSNDIVSWIFNEMNGSSDVTDLIQTTLIDGTTSVSAAENSGLGDNAALVKEGVVEFMKYRAPALAIESIFDELSEKGEEIQNDLENASQDSELAEKRDDFAEIEGDLSKKEFYTYYYYYKYRQLTPTNKELEEMVTAAEDVAETYKTLTKESIQKYWINQAGLPSTTSKHTISHTVSSDKKIYNISCNESNYNMEKTAKDYADETVKDGDNETYYISWSSINSATQELETAISGLNTALKNADTAMESYTSLYGDGNNQTNKEQWYYFARKDITDHLKTINEKGDVVAKAWIKLATMRSCEPKEGDTGFTSGWDTKADGYISQADTLLSNVFWKFDVGDDENTTGYKYLKVLNELCSVGSSARSSCQTGTASSTISSCASSLNDYKKQLQSYIDALNKVIKGPNKFDFTEPSDYLGLDDLRDYVEAYEGEYEEWKTQANNTTTSLGKQQRTEIKNDYEAKKRTVGPEDVDEFKGRLEKVRDFYQEIIDTIDEMQYGNKEIVKITDYNGFYDQFKEQFTTPSKPMTNVEMSQMADNIYDTLFEPQRTPIISLSKLGDSQYKLVLEKGDDKYYTFLCDKFGSISDDDLDSKEKTVKSKEDKLDDLKEQEEEATDSEDNKDKKEGTDVELGKDINGGANSYVSGFSGTKFNDSEIIKSFASTIKDAFTMNSSSMRDSLYATMYAMNMFSYRTYVYEGKYDLCKDVTYANYKEKYKAVSGTGKGQWGSTALSDSYNKTLTNRMINSANNAANNAEIEYILYGGTNKQNLNKAYMSIYGLRYALNLASGFVNFYSNADSPTADAIEAAAYGIWVATSGIVPEPVTKCVLIALLAALESVHDMNVLINGIPLKVYKVDEDDWTYSLTVSGKDSDDVSTSPDDNKTLNSDGICMQYGDYLFLFLYSSFKSSGKLSEAAYARMGRVIESNMQLADSGNTDYSLSKAKTMFEFKSDAKVPALMMDQPLASDFNGMLKDGSWNTYRINMSRGY